MSPDLGLPIYTEEEPYMRDLPHIGFFRGYIGGVGNLCPCYVPRNFGYLISGDLCPF